MHRVPTIQIKMKSDGRIRIIDESAFDPADHEHVGATARAAFDREAAKATLDAAGVKYAKNVGDAKLAELVAALDAPKALSVRAMPDGFIIVNAAGEQQGETFKTEEDAKLMLEMLG